MSVSLRTHLFTLSDMMAEHEGNKPNILIENPRKEGPFGRICCKWQNGVKTDLNQERAH